MPRRKEQQQQPRKKEQQQQPRRPSSIGGKTWNKWAEKKQKDAFAPLMIQDKLEQLDPTQPEQLTKEVWTQQKHKKHINNRSPTLADIQTQSKFSVLRDLDGNFEISREAAEKLNDFIFQEIVHSSTDVCHVGPNHREATKPSMVQHYLEMLKGSTGCLCILK